MIQLNLLPDLKKEYIHAQKTKGMVISASVLVTLGAIGLSILLFVYVTFVQQLQIGLATDDIERKAQQLREITDVDKYLTVQHQLVSLPQLHDEKGAYSRLFDFLSVMNPSPPNNVALNNLQVLTLDNSIVLSGTTATFETLNVFVDTLKNAQVSYRAGGEGETITETMFDQVLVQSSGLARQEGNTVVSFTIRTIHKPSVFTVGNTNMQATVPNITTTPSVQLTPRPSAQIFDSNSVQPEGQ